MQERVKDFITENGLLMLGQTVGVAVSGGPDSMALLHCLLGVAPFFSCSIACVHFEHGIRGSESLADADFVSQWCAEHRVPFYMSAADVPALAQAWGVSTETAAKRARETYFNSLVENGEVDVIATGHHKDDNAESVLMHILRGSGIDGLKGIALRNANMIRPLLCVSRGDILGYLRENGVPFVEDQTNENTEHTRNFVRNVLLPQMRERINPDVSGALNRLSEIAEEDAAFLISEAEKAFEACTRTDGDKIKIDAERFLGLASAVAYRVLKIACAKLYVTCDIEKVHVGAVMRLARNMRTGTCVNLSNHLCAELEYGTLIIRFTGRREDHSFCMSFDPEAKNELKNGDYVTCERVDECDFQNADPYTAYVDADRLPPRLKLRTRYAGDRIAPLGNGGSKKLKDYFIDKKLTREEREKTPLLAEGSTIVWVIGHTIGDAYRVTDATERILRMRYIRAKRQNDMTGEES